MKKMNQFNYTPIKSNKKIADKLLKFNQFISLGVKKICVGREEFMHLHSSMSKEHQEFYKHEIPYKGAIIYSVDYRAPETSQISSMYIDDIAENNNGEELDGISSETTRGIESKS